MCLPAPPWGRGPQAVSPCSEDGREQARGDQRSEPGKTQVLPLPSSPSYFPSQSLFVPSLWDFLRQAGAESRTQLSIHLDKGRLPGSQAETPGSLASQGSRNTGTTQWSSLRL